MDISLYKWLPRDIGDIQTSHCTNGSKEKREHRKSVSMGQRERGGSRSVEAAGEWGQRERGGSGSVGT